MMIQMIFIIMIMIMTMLMTHNNNDINYVNNTDNNKTTVPLQLRRVDRTLQSPME